MTVISIKINLIINLSILCILYLLRFNIKAYIIYTIIVVFLLNILVISYTHVQQFNRF